MVFNSLQPERHLLPGMWSGIFLLPDHGMFWRLAPGLNGLRWSCGYLPPTTLLYHEQGDVLWGWLWDLGSWGSLNSLAPTVYALHIPLLPVQGIRSLLLWCPGYRASWPVWTPGPMSTWFLWALSLFLPPSFPRHHCFLWQFFLLSTTMRSKDGRKGLHHLFNTFNCGDILLCSFCLHLSSAQGSLLLAEDKILAVFYTILTPMLNPIIYSLRVRKSWGPWRAVWGLLFYKVITMALFTLLYSLFLWWLGSPRGTAIW